MKTKAAVCYEVGKPVVVEEIELRPPKASEVMIKIGASGVCHSDLSLLNGTIVHTLPEVLGHEGAGTVVEVGEETADYKVGDRVMLSFVSSCGHCFQCQSGHPTLCEAWFGGDRGLLLDGTCRFHKGDRDIHQFARLGTMSEYAVVHTDSVVALPDGYEFRHAALIGCGVPTGVGAVLRTAKVQPGQSVCVIGTGGVGLNVVQGARLSGANPIIAVDRLDNKLEAARQFGATHTINASKVDPVEAVRELTGGHGVEYAFEVIGLKQTIETAFELIRIGGQAVIIGITNREHEVSFPAFMFPYGERKVVGSFMGSCLPREDMPRFLELYSEGKLMLDELVTRTYSLDEVNQAFADLEEGRNLRGMILFEE